MSAPTQSAPWRGTLVVPLTEAHAWLDNRAGDHAVLAEDGFGLLRDLTVADLMEIGQVEPFGLVELTSANGCYQLRHDVPAAGLRAGHHIFASGGKTPRAWLHLTEPQAVLVIRAALLCGLSDWQLSKGATVEGVREWVRARSPVQSAGRARRRQGAPRGAAHPYYRRNPVPPLRLVAGGAA